MQKNKAKCKLEMRKEKENKQINEIKTIVHVPLKKLKYYFMQI